VPTVTLVPVKTMITGAAGQLGTDLVQAATARGDEVVAVDHQRLDITDASAVSAFVQSESPDTIINCAAWTAVDNCESDADRAQLVNAAAVEYLASAADAAGAHLLQISTDYVFDGTKVGAYVESDATNPQSVYGASKLGGEQAAAEHTIARISWVCGEHGNNMVKTILRLAGEHDTLSFVDDQRGHPCFTADLAPKLLDLAEARAGGIFHVTNQGAVSWFEFAQEVLRASGADPERVSPIATADLQPARPAPRPANSVLDNGRLVAEGFGPLLRDFREPLAELVAALS